MTALDPEAVVGDEAHIAARSPGGSRYGECPPDKVDSYENLILLCRVDHKKIDDQPKHFTTARLHRRKAQHEAWVERQLDDQPAPIRFELDGDGSHALRLLTTGGDVWDVVQGAHRYLLDDLDEEGADEDDLDCSGAFLQNAKDWGEISSEISDQGPRAVRNAKKSLADDLTALRERGLVAFGGQRHGRITGGVGSPTPFTDALLVIIRADDERIRRQQ